MLSSVKTKSASNAPGSWQPSAQSLLQRKCACGNKAGAEGECEECRKNKGMLQRREGDNASPSFLGGHDFSRVAVSLQPKLVVNPPGDVYEQEADRVAAAVVKQNAEPQSPLKRKPAASIQREEEKKKAPTEAEKYAGAAKLAGEAFLQTNLGKQVTGKVATLGEDFLSTVHGKVITGTVVTGAITALAATNSPLPFQLPEIPLDSLATGLSVKLTYEGPVLKPTGGSIMFIYRFGGGDKKSAPSMPEPRRDFDFMQRKASNIEPATSEVPPIVHDVLRSPGQPLDEATRAFFEPRFGHDFSNVRVHTDAKAAESARAVNARAYTVGRDVVFGGGRFETSSHEGKSLLAHELTHVRQQAASNLSATSLNLDNSAVPEQEAERTSEKLLLNEIASFYPNHKSAGLQRAPAPSENSFAAMPLEEALKNIHKMSQDQALLVLKRYQKSIQGSINSGEGRIRELMSLRAESFSNYLIGGTIEVFGGTSLPSDNWEEPWRHLNAAYGTIYKRQVKESLDHIRAAEYATIKHWQELNKYLEQTDKGADRSIFALQVVQAAGAVAATALTGGGATAVAVGTGYGLTQNLAGQATAISIGIQDKIDWGGVAFDTIFGALTGALGGKLGNALLKKLMGNKAVASLGRRVLAEVTSDIVSGKLSSILHTTGRALFDQLRGRENLTMEQFIEHLAEQLMDPKAGLIDIITGRFSKIAHAPSSKAPKKSAQIESQSKTVVAADTPSRPAVEPEPLTKAPASPSKVDEVIPKVEASTPNKAATKAPEVVEPLPPSKAAVPDSAVAKPIEPAKPLEAAPSKSAAEKPAAIAELLSNKFSVPETAATPKSTAKSKAKSASKTKPEQKRKRDQAKTKSKEKFSKDEQRQIEILEEFAEGQKKASYSDIESDVLEQPGVQERAKPGGKPVPEKFDVGNFSHQYAEMLIPASKLPRGLDPEFKISDANKRVDRVDWKNGKIYEIKPNTPSQIAAGENQIKIYKAYLDKHYPLPGGQKWTGGVVTYNKDAARRLMKKIGWTE